MRTNQQQRSGSFKLPRIKFQRTSSSRSTISSGRSNNRNNSNRRESPGMTQTYIDEIPPAVRPGMEGKFLTFRPLKYNHRPPAPRNLGYFFKFHSSDVKLIKWLLEDNGIREGNKNWIMLWSNGGLRSQIYQSMNRWQRTNHFPRTHEMTKKDNLLKNITRMKSLHGVKHFDFIPETYILPQDYNDVVYAMDQDPSKLWIIKPSAMSQGKGIFLTRNIYEFPPGPQVASVYLANPLLINGLKFDLRIYVAVTCINPLRIYIYEEGLVRFATEKFDLSNPENRFIHLTNYSLNKHSPNFVDNEQEDSGHKWSLTALKRLLAKQGIDFEIVWGQIKDIVIKTLISVENTVNSAVQMFVGHRKNCFELLGFDILVDDQLKAWLLEVNLSPSLNIDSTLDLSIKSELVADLLNLACIPNRQQYKKRRIQVQKPEWNDANQTQIQTLSLQEQQVLRETDKEMQRKGKFERIFPSENSLMYKSFFEQERPYNTLLMSQYSKSELNIRRERSFARNGEIGRVRALKQVEDSRGRRKQQNNLKMGSSLCHCCENQKSTALTEFSLNAYQIQQEKKTVTETPNTSAQTILSQQPNQFNLRLRVINSGNLQKGYNLVINSFGLAGGFRSVKDGNVFFGCKKKLNGKVVNDFVIPVNEQQCSSQYRGQHFVIYFRQDFSRYYIRDLAIGFGTFMRIDDALALKDNFLINIGESYVVINIDPMMQLQIKIFGAPYKGVIFTYQPIEDKLIQIGRNYICDIKMDDPLLSKVQCSFKFKNDQWFVNDGNWDTMRQSTNGTWLYLSEDTLIYDKMVIKANQTLFQAEHIFSQSDGVNI